MNTTETEHGQFFHLLHHTYDIDAALALIAATPGRETHTLDVAQAARTLGLDKTPEEHRADHKIPLMGMPDEEWARNHADLSQPVIMVDTMNTWLNGEPAWMLADGYHRLRRAYLEGVAGLEAYALNAKESWSIRVDGARVGKRRKRRKM